jgi:ubiquinone/menaquinone biosynthesis C-methylase UbiE
MSTQTPLGTAPDPRSAAAAPVVIARPAEIRRFDRWAESYESSQLQGLLYGRVHDAVVRQARRRVRDPGQILDIGCGTGRLLGRIVPVCPHARVVGVDASTEMIRNARTRPAAHSPRFVSAMAECLPFADAAFHLVVITLSLSHWRDQAAGLAEVSRVMAPGATLLVADVLPARPSRRVKAAARRRGPAAPRPLPQLITASGLRVRHVEPIRSVAIIAGVTLIAAEKTG